MLGLRICSKMKNSERKKIAKKLNSLKTEILDNGGTFIDEVNLKQFSKIRNSKNLEAKIIQSDEEESDNLIQVYENACMWKASIRQTKFHFFMKIFVCVFRKLKKELI